MKEVWKNIKGYEGLYKISNLGRILSENNYKRIENTIMVPQNNGNGYKYISLSKNNVRKNYYIHRLVAEHFIKKTKGKNVVDHIDYDKTNNKTDNLRWVTQEENVNHSRINMIGLERNVKPGNSGERYIIKRRRSNKYALVVPKRYFGYKKEIGRYGTLQEAIEKRKEVIGW